ncbi:MAG: hypothetical protein IKS65_10465, partial [Bacteroidales bacterium]|nr:hypothetical protein [Bacteroidales bacterium]
VHPEPGSNSSLYIVVLILFSVVPGGFTCSSLFGILGSLPFRLLFIGSLLSKNFAIIISVDCGCKSTPFFYTRNTFFKIFLNYFFKADYQRFVMEIFPGGTKISLETPFQRPDLSPLLEKFYAKVTLNGIFLINFGIF